jgi:hypothetical protein
MRYRRLDENYDYSFGTGQQDFYVNVPEAVGQSVMTRLMLFQGEWFADLTQGTPWQTEVLGERTQKTRDLVVVDRVRQTVGVNDILAYSSTTDVNQRSFSAQVTIDTIYGAVELVSPRLPGVVPPLPVPPLRPVQHGLLGIRGGRPPMTDVSMTEANLGQPGQQNIADFVVQQADAGTY